MVARGAKELGEFILSYDAVRQAESPDETLLEFLQTTYEAAANLVGWDRKTLEHKVDFRGADSPASPPVPRNSSSD